MKPRRKPSGQGKFLLLVGLAAFATSTAIFLGYAWPKWFPREVSPPQTIPPQPAPTPIPAPESSLAPEPPSSESKTDPPGGGAATVRTRTSQPPDIPDVVGPIQPPAVMEKLATAFLAEDPDGVLAALGRRLVTVELLARLGALLASHDLDASNAVSQLGSQPALQRWALHLKPTGRPHSEPVTVEVDFLRDDRGQWWPGGLSLPDDNAEKPAAIPEADAEAIATARSVGGALVTGAMADLLPLVDPERLSPAQATGLAAMLQEGGFALKADSAPVVTMANPTQLWLMLPVVSAQWQTESQFGIILRKKSAGEPWLVVALNTESLLAVTSNRLGAGDAATSLIRNPGQPDALCLYFASGSSEPDERARRVLALAAAMLNADPELRLLVLGHTDATEKDGDEQKLSKARVESAAKSLAAAGIPAGFIERETHGPRRPRRANFLPEGTPDPRALVLNRRVELIFQR